MIEGLPSIEVWLVRQAQPQWYQFHMLIGLQHHMVLRHECTKVYHPMAGQLSGMEISESPASLAKCINYIRAGSLHGGSTSGDWR